MSNTERLVLNDPGQLETVGEPRNFARVDDHLLVSYSAAYDELDVSEIPWAFCETYDIGSGGIAIITNVELAADQDVRVQLELRGDSRPPLQVAGVCRWSRFDPLLRRYRTGIEFVNMTQQAEMDILRYVDTLRMLRDMGVL